MAKPAIDFFYFFGSGYAYLAVMRIDEASKRAGVEVRWRPFSVRTLMRENNIGLRNQPGKMRYIWRDIERRAKWHGIPFVKPPIWPTDPDELANRVAVVAVAAGWGRDYTKASFKSWYLDGQPLGEPTALDQVLSSLGRDPAEVVAKANSVRLSQSPLSDHARLIVDVRLNRFTVIRHRVLVETIDARRYDRPVLSHIQKNVLRVFWRPFEPVRIVKGAAKNSDVRKPLKRHKQFCSAGVAEVNVDVFSASCGAVLIDLWLTRNDVESGGLEDGFYKIRGTCGSLAELTVANR